MLFHQNRLIMPNLLFLKKQRNLKVSSAANQGDTLWVNCVDKGPVKFFKQKSTLSPSKGFPHDSADN